MNNNPTLRRLGAFMLAALPVFAASDELTGSQIFQRCYNKYQGDDQRSRLGIVLTDEGGKKIGYEFIRLWKDYKGKNGVEDKVVMYTLSPPDSKDVNFMRWGYATTTGRLADQWVYLPELRTVRRVSQRDPKNMDWGFTDEDLRIRTPDEDEHRLAGIEAVEDQEFYVVENVPKKDSIYGKRVSMYIKTPNLDDCVESRVDYYDKKGEIIKRQTVHWQKVKGAWVWKTAVMKNMQNNNSAVYDMRDIEINVGLSDDLFTERALKRGYVK